MRKLFGTLKKFRLQLVLGPIFKLIEAVFELIVPVVMAKIIDVGVKNHDTAYIWKMGGVLVLLGVVGLCSTLVCQYFAAIASQGTGTVIRNDLFSHISRLSRAELDKFGPSGLTTRLTNDVNVLQHAVAMLIRLVVRAPFLVIGAVIMTFSINRGLALIILPVLPLLAIALYFIMSRSAPLFSVIQSKLDRISRITGENLSGARVIRAYAKQDSEHDRFSRASDDVVTMSVKVGKLSALLNPLTAVIVNFGILAIIWFGGLDINAGGMTQGELIAFINYMNQILLAMVVVANLTVTFTKAAACVKRVGEIFDTAPSVTDENADSGLCIADAEKRSDTAVRFKNVSFKYGDGNGNVKSADAKNSGAKNGQEAALQNISFDIKKGSTIGIIGGTGSGKTTLINLISRIYDATDGDIEIFGEPIKKYQLDELRRAVAYVPQKTAVISDTVSANLRMGSPDATDDELWEALSVAQGSEFVSAMPHKLETRITEGGKNISGGQRQRLTIARAVAAKPKILILDDSTSALDAATDLRLRKAVSEYSEKNGVSVIFVSQRAGTVMGCDNIIVLDDGAVAGIGTHSELVRGCKVYGEICTSQNITE